MKGSGVRLLAGVLGWVLATVSTFEMVRAHFRPKEIVTWLLWVLFATAMTLPIRKWPLKVRIPFGLLMVAFVGYYVYITRVGWSILWALAAIALYVGIALALRRWAPWRWAKSQWTLVALAAGLLLIAAWVATLKT